MISQVKQTSTRFGVMKDWKRILMIRSECGMCEKYFEKCGFSHMLDCQPDRQNPFVAFLHPRRTNPDLRVKSKNNKKVHRRERVQ